MHDFTIINEKYAAFVNDDYDLKIIPLDLPPGKYNLDEKAKHVKIPHEDICGCIDKSCLKKLVSHLLCANYFIIYGITWCLLVKIFKKNNPFSFPPDVFTIETEDTEDEAVDEDEEVIIKKFIPDPINCIQIETDEEQNNFNFDIAILEFDMRS